MTFYDMYMALGVAGIVASLIFSVVYFKLSTSFKEVRHLLKQTLCVLVCKFFHILMIMCSVACRIYTLLMQRHERYGLWLLHGMHSLCPLGCLYSLSATFYASTLWEELHKLFTGRLFTNIASTWCLSIMMESKAWRYYVQLHQGQIVFLSLAPLIFLYHTQISYLKDHTLSVILDMAAHRYLTS